MYIFWLTEPKKIYTKLLNSIQLVVKLYNTIYYTDVPKYLHRFNKEQGVAITQKKKI